jgi:hypothetical protein
MCADPKAGGPAHLWCVASRFAFGEPHAAAKAVEDAKKKAQKAAEDAKQAANDATAKM